MRKDFDKVLTERPRVGGGGGYRSNKRIKEEEVHEDFSRKSEPMSMGRGSKEFTDLISPLYRWMEKQVGRPWNKVYSEIKDNFASNNLQHQHLIQHVRWMVDLNCFKKNHKIYNSQGLEVNSLGSRRPQFYVLDDGLLKMIKKARTKYGVIPSNPNCKVIDGKTYKADKDGIWYEIELSPVPKDRICSDAFFNIKGLKGYNFLPDSVREYNKRGVYCTKKTQLSKRDKKKLKLT